MRDQSPIPDSTLRMRRVFSAPPRTVFEAWTEPGQLLRWFCPDGYVLLDVEVDLRVDGTYRFEMRTPEGQLGHIYGTFREVSPTRRLVYTWAWKGVTPEGEQVRSEETLVTVEFRDVGGSTEVLLTHERFPDLESKKRHEGGWAGTLVRLETLLRAADRPAERASGGEMCRYKS